MNITSFIRKHYENKHLRTRRKNKAKTNPIKPNLLDAQMNLTSFLTKDYENKRLCTRRENKPNQTQNKPNYFSNAVRSSQDSRFLPVLLFEVLLAGGWGEFIGYRFAKLFVECPFITYVFNGVVCCFKKIYILLGEIIGDETQYGPDGRRLVFKLFVCAVFTDKLRAVPGWLKYGGKIDRMSISIYPERLWVGEESFDLVV